MANNSYEDFKYDSCTSRGICSISPRTSALQTVLVLYLRLFAKYAVEIPPEEICVDHQNFILNIIAMTVFNPNFNENSFIESVNIFRKILPEIMETYSFLNPKHDIDKEKSKPLEIFRETSDIIRAIRFGEKMFRRGQENVPVKIQDLYNTMLVISNSISINLLELNSYEEKYPEAFKTILNLLSRINLEEKDIEKLKTEIIESAVINNKLMKKLHDTQEKYYGKQGKAKVSFSTAPSKAVLVAGSNIRELEMVLENLKNNDIDIYTHDEMILAHTFPHFSTYKKLKGQFGQGIENCLLDFATFPGPIILTKHSLHNIENLYRGRLFTTDFTCPKGVIRVQNEDFSEVIKSAENSKGFKRGKQCESIEIGYNLEETIETIKACIDKNGYKNLFYIGLEQYSLEQGAYFEKLIKYTPKDTLIISFSYEIEQENLIHINSCFDSYALVRIFDELQSLSLKTVIFFPKCNRNTISEMIYLSNFENTSIYVGKCTPIVLNPTLMSTLEEIFKLIGITSAKKDLNSLLNN